MPAGLPPCRASLVRIRRQFRRIARSKRGSQPAEHTSDCRLSLLAARRRLEEAVETRGCFAQITRADDVVPLKRRADLVQKPAPSVLGAQARDRGQAQVQERSQ